MTKYTFTVSEEDAGTRLDVFIAKNVADLSRTHVKKLLAEGQAFVKHQDVNASYKLKVDDEVHVKIPEAASGEIEAEDIPLDVVYEDKDMIVVNKAAGMVVHPTESGHHMSGTLVNAILFHCKDLAGIGGVLRPGIVHRLDKGTSGLVMIAKNDAAQLSLSQQIKDRKVTKEYFTLVKGRIEPEEGSIDAPIGRSISDRKKMAVLEHHSSRDALTHYKVEEYIGSYSLLRVEIVTGRTHQIRVHFQAIGFPVVGDETYGENKTNRLFKGMGLRRPFLHASKLGIRLPSSDEWKEFEAELPEDLNGVLEQLRA